MGIQYILFGGKRIVKKISEKDLSGQSSKYKGTEIKGEKLDLLVLKSNQMSFLVGYIFNAINRKCI